MRHVVLPGAIASGPRRMVHPTAAAVLVAPPSRALGVAPCRLCTALGAVNLAAVTVAADDNLILAARAQKQPSRRCRCRGQQRTWTRPAMIGILPRHACSARCGARRRSETWPLRSAPCRPRQSARFLPRAKQVAQGRQAPRGKPVGLWTTQACCPQTHSHNSSHRQSKQSGNQQRQASARFPIRLPRNATRRRWLRPFRRL